MSAGLGNYVSAHTRLGWLTVVWSRAKVSRAM
jgi:hypothetical protein